MSSSTIQSIVRITVLAIGGLTLVGRCGTSQAQDPSAEALRAGKSFLETKVYTPDDDRKVLELFAGLRVADVSDGMDQAGLANVGLVIEDDGTADVGSIGSNNIMGWKTRGCVGVVTSATARDTDDIIAEKVPRYFQRVGRGIRPGRNEIESVNRPVVVGGVQVMPGDVVVADGDGVIVVPREHAEKVAKYARATLESDKAARRGLYQQLGLPEDDSVR